MFTEKKELSNVHQEKRIATCSPRKKELSYVHREKKNRHVVKICHMFTEKRFVRCLPIKKNRHVYREKESQHDHRAKRIATCSPRKNNRPMFTEKRFVRCSPRKKNCHMLTENKNRHMFTEKRFITCSPIIHDTNSSSFNIVLMKFMKFVSLIRIS